MHPIALASLAFLRRLRRFAFGPTSHLGRLRPPRLPPELPRGPRQAPPSVSVQFSSTRVGLGGVDATQVTSSSEAPGSAGLVSWVTWTGGAHEMSAILRRGKRWCKSGSVTSVKFPNPRARWGKCERKPPPAGQRTRFPSSHRSVAPGAGYLCCRAQKGRVVGRESNGELNWLFRLQVREAGAVASKVSLSQRRYVKQGPWLPLAFSAQLRDPADFLIRKSCVPGHALSAAPWDRSVPAPLPPAPPSNQRPGQGAAPREPAPPIKGTQLDSGQRAGVRRGAPLCLPSPRALSQQLSVPQRASPSEKGPV